MSAPEMKNDAASTTITAGAELAAMRTPASGTPTMPAVRLIPSKRPEARSSGMRASSASAGTRTRLPVSPAPRTAPAIAASPARIGSDRWPLTNRSGMRPIATPAVSSDVIATRHAPTRSTHGPPTAMSRTYGAGLGERHQAGLRRTAARRQDEPRDGEHRHPGAEGRDAVRGQQAEDPAPSPLSHGAARLGDVARVGEDLELERYASRGRVAGPVSVRVVAMLEADRVEPRHQRHRLLRRQPHPVVAHGRRVAPGRASAAPRPTPPSARATRAHASQVLLPEQRRLVGFDGTQVEVGGPMRRAPPALASVPRHLLDRPSRTPRAGGGGSWSPRSTPRAAQRGQRGAVDGPLLAQRAEHSEAERVREPPQVARVEHDVALRVETGGRERSIGHACKDTFAETSLQGRDGRPNVSPRA